MHFQIDEQYLTDVRDEHRWNIYEGKTDLTQEEMIRYLKDEGWITSFGSKDHPNFTQLRDSLEAQGYIKTVRNYWNGDSVIKDFFLNGFSFKKGKKFPCAAALRNSIEHARKRNSKTLSL